MAKAPKTAYVCNDCGAEFSRWLGQCSACKAWNTITEVRLISTAKSKMIVLVAMRGNSGKIQTLSEISLQETPRFSSGFNELDRVLGGGIVPGSAILIGGHPGAGKYLVITGHVWFSENMTALYVTGEGIVTTGCDACKSIGIVKRSIKMLSETSVEQVCNLADQLKPQIIVVDSIQVMHLADIQSSPGSVAQGRVNVLLSSLVMRKPTKLPLLWWGM